MGYHEPNLDRLQELQGGKANAGEMRVPTSGGPHEVVWFGFVLLVGFLNRSPQWPPQFCPGLSMQVQYSLQLVGSPLEGGKAAQFPAQWRPLWPGAPARNSFADLERREA